MSSNLRPLSEALLVKVCVLLTIALAISLVATMFAVRAAAMDKTSVIATDADATVVPVVPLDKPGVHEPRVVAFAEECVRRAFSHDFLHHDETLKSAQECFTPEGADAYADIIAPWFKLMDEKRLNMAIVFRRPAQVARRGADDQGAATWDLITEVDISLEGRNESIPATRYRVEMTVKRIALRKSPRGLAVSRLYIKPAT